MSKSPRTHSHAGEASLRGEKVGIQAPTIAGPC